MVAGIGASQQRVGHSYLGKSDRRTCNKSTRLPSFLYRVFLYDATAAIVVSKNSEMAAILVYQTSLVALNNLCPSCISDLFGTYKPTRSLRSSSRNLLVILRSKLKSYGDRAFSTSAPKLWNVIPETIKCSVDLNSFKRKLKTYLFKRYFNE